MSFDRIARHYDWMEALTAGSRLETARTRWLDQLSGAEQILSVGEGHGRFATACALRHPKAHLTCIEPSDGMWGLATRRFKRAGIPLERITRIPISLPSEKLPWHSFDAIVTCFFLDCFPPKLLRVVIESLTAVAAPNAAWLNTDFAVPPGGPARWRAQAIHWAMYQFFRLTTGLRTARLSDPDPSLRQTGFRLAGRTEYEWGLIRADYWRRTTSSAEHRARPAESHLGCG